jgi:hypothetical protein
MIKLTIRFYIIVLKYLKLILDVHYYPFRPQEISELMTYGDKRVRRRKTKILKETDIFLQELQQKIKIDKALKYKFYEIVIRFLCVLLSVHFYPFDCAMSEEALLSRRYRMTLGGHRHKIIKDAQGIVEEIYNSGLVERPRCNESNEEKHESGQESELGDRREIPECLAR